MRKVLVCLTVALLAGCASRSKSTNAPSTSAQSTSAQSTNAQDTSTQSTAPKVGRLAAAAQEESRRLAAPSQPLSTFSDFELKPMVLSAGVAGRKEKAEVAKQLEDRLRTRLTPLIEEWKADKSSPRTGGTLVIQPQLQSLRIVSGGARFMVGSLSGSSVVEMSLQLIDGKTGTIIANPLIGRTASGSGGAWTMGATDRNLLNYIVEISRQYLVDNYKK